MFELYLSQSKALFNIMVAVVRNELSHPIPIHGHFSNTFGKGVSPTIFSLQIRQIEVFSLGNITSLREGKQQVK